MTRLRFTTAREVFDAFPTASEDISAPPSDDGPWAYVKALMASPTPEDAITFCAYLLPRREAVWWACQCVRMMAVAPGDDADTDAIEAAEAWVREPEENRRRIALQYGMTGDRQRPATWLSLAAGWSGGSMVEGDHPIAAPPHLTAKAARAAVLIGLARGDARQRTAKVRAVIEAGVDVAGGDVRELG
jgi:hypothetical protein